MLNPELICHGNVATVNFITRFGEHKFINYYKRTEDIFNLSYSVIQGIEVLKAQVKSIYKKYIEIYTLKGVKRALYCGDIKHGEELYIVEYTHNVDYQWVAIKELPSDIECISINIDILKGNHVINRLVIDPYFGGIEEI